MFHTPPHKVIPAVDVRVSSHGHNLFLLEAVTPAARAWCDDHLPDAAKWGRHSYAIEPRYVSDVVDGLDGDGLSIE